MKKEVQDIRSKMTLEEKASLCSGQDFWHIKGVERLSISATMLADGPHGLRKQADTGKSGLGPSIPATCFPTAVALASSWDRDLLHEVGVALGEECLQEKVAVLLGPGANIKRSPLCGRNFEYFSEDPYVTGELAAQMIMGVQSQGIGTALKHFAVNNQEGHRMTIDAFVDERALREIYLAGFETAVKVAKPWTLMCSYNLINGTYASENPYLLRHILKEEWQHTGIVMSDWGAVNNRIDGLQAGLELEMPGPNRDNDDSIVQAVKAVKAGQLKEEILDTATERLLELIIKGRDNQREGFTYDQKEHHALSRKAATQSMVLLKNEGSILPLKHSANIAVIGEFAVKPRYQGAGSSLVNPTQLDVLYHNQPNVSYARGYDLQTDQPQQPLIDEAVALARKSEVVVIMAGLTESYESEGFDRVHMRMPEAHNELIHQIAEVNKNIIVVLSNGSPVEMPWLPKVKGVLEAYLSGQASGSAIWQILYGEVNPSGKLAETFPLKATDCAASDYFPMGPRGVEYRESIYVGYRYYDTAQKEVLFPFGFGLSYTQFEYSDLKTNKDSLRDTEPLTLSFKIKNTGAVSGKEIAQIYVKDLHSTLFRPEKELKGFAKVDLEPGEEKVVHITLDQRAFAFYNVNIKDWQVESGTFEIIIAASSRDLRLTAEVEVISSIQFEEIGKDVKAALITYYNPQEKWSISKESFENLYGREIMPIPVSKKGSYHMNSTTEELRTCFLGRLFYSLMMWMARSTMKDVDPLQMGMILTGINEMPFRNLKMNSEGRINQKTVDILLHLFNGHYLKAIKHLFSPQKH